MAAAATPRGAGAAEAGGRRRASIRVTGTVQGVGFRPFVFRLAGELGLDGFVLNDERGVLSEAEGEPATVERFVARLTTEAPPLATVESVQAVDLEPTGERGFRIVESERAGEPEALVSPDTASCPDCLAEVRDPADRRYRYPFTNCTNCGPRFTIVRDVPYDRSLTTMAAFPMCDECRAEYDDPRDRRFHAQPNACPRCGPRVWLTDAAGAELAPEPGTDPVAAAAREVSAGRVLALKGIGGFHLACRADDATAVAALRSRKHREEKPFALMAPGIEAARELVELTAEEEALLQGRERPIVIARRLPDAPVAEGVAPRSRDLGVMLPYSPLHHLLAGDTGATLVMTSGNVSDEPIAFGDGEALERLGAIADRFLLHDRPIHIRTDDSVVRAVAPALRPAPLLLRRSRGYVPGSTGLPVPCRLPTLGCGAELKSTFCLAKGRRAWIGHHIGDLKNWETLRSFRDGVEHFQRLFAVSPAIVAHDLHPDYLSTRYALDREGVELEAVQHHHAHLAACLAEHGAAGPAVGAIFDGSGHGPDGTVWGGEILAADAASFERAGMLFPVRLPGGDAAVAEPWRMACAWLVAATGEDRPRLPASLRDQVEEGSWESVCALVGSGVSSPLTTSAGRLFDAAAAICGVRSRVSYEGQAAAELEGAADPAERGSHPLPLIDAGATPAGGCALILDARTTLLALSDDLGSGTPVPTAAARFHNGLAGATAAACEREAEARGVDLVVLSGGVFQNRLLLERTGKLLAAAGLRVLIPRLLPPNDGGIAYGQVAVAAARGTGR